MPIAKVGILNYGIGNIKSLKNALKYLNYEMIEITEYSNYINRINIIIIPGVGSYSGVISALINRGLTDLIYEADQIKMPIIGICSGMQILSSYGTEDGLSNGLNLIEGTVEKMDLDKLRIPQIGFNEVTFNSPTNLQTNKGNRQLFYFLNSYHFIPKDYNTVTATYIYEKKFVASIKKENIAGVQFHPEKSNFKGLFFLKNMIDAGVRGE